MTTNIRFVSAGAGSGKTFRLTEELEEALVAGRAKPEGVIGTTFTKKAANELRERVRQRLIQSGHNALANQMGQALLGTVNSVCGRLLGRFAFEAGLPPELEVVPEEDAQLMFNRAVDDAVSASDVRRMNEISERMGIQDKRSKKDWRNDLSLIASTARANDMQLEEFAEWGKRSANGLIGLFPSTVKENLWDALGRAVSEAILGIRANGYATKGTEGYLRLLQGLQQAINEKRLAWSNWVKLSKADPTKKSMALAEPVKAVAAQYHSHPQLQEDIREYCGSITRLAADALKQYQEMKKKRGMIDFVDQEQFMLHALDRPDVRAVLSEELDLLLVDEFQDTSPIQLALFLKLAGAAREAIFVGDIKQAIYGFRGSDPELMLAVQREIEKQGGRPDILETSRRSRPALIDYTNALFIPAFSKSIPSGQVRLKPHRKEKTKEPAVMHWALSGRNAGMRTDAMALGITKLVQSGYRVVDKDTEEPREVCYSDIAILAKTNMHVAELAHGFAAKGIPTQMERTGLLRTPEACLSMACLRRLADASDTLASAEIIALSDCGEPESWLGNRLGYFAAGKPWHLWGEIEGFEHPVLASISCSREELRCLSPAEALAFVIRIADVRRTLASWGPNEWRLRQRLQNIDALIAFAEKYEDHCKTQKQAATIGGLIIWLQDLKSAELDTQPGDAKSNAVRVLTHHGAKGLEWPVVIAADLNDDLKSRVWGLNLVSEKGRIDLEKPLAGRFLRFWPYPFGGQKKAIPIVDLVEDSDFGKLCADQEREESKRLLYVSLTRARDLLVIALPDKKPSGEWMGLLQAEWMLPQGKKLKLPGGKEIPSEFWHLDASTTKEAKTTEDYRPFWFGESKEPTEKLPAVRNASAIEPWPGARVGEHVSIGKALKITGAETAENIGVVLHQLIASEAINPSQVDAEDLIRKLLYVWGLKSSLDAGAVLAYIRQFFKLLVNKYQPTRILAEYPVTHVLKNGQLVKGWVDLLLETPKGWVIVDHKFTEKPNSDLEPETLKYSGQLKAYVDAVGAATERQVPECWVHFPGSGKMILLVF
jgi:ATP-dependent exoDNAse (exonuclease V) beta subunit